MGVGKERRILVERKIWTHLNLLSIPDRGKSYLNVRLSWNIGGPAKRNKKTKKLLMAFNRVIFLDGSSIVIVIGSTL